MKATKPIVGNFYKLDLSLNGRWHVDSPIKIGKVYKIEDGYVITECYWEDDKLPDSPNPHWQQAKLSVWISTWVKAKAADVARARKKGEICTNPET